MGWTKRELVEEAYAELALASYSFDRTPEMDLRACRRLDALMAWWDFRGVRLGYSLASSPDATDLDTDSGLPLYAVEPVVATLACALCAGMGKAPPPLTVTKAREGFSLLLSNAAEPIEQQMPARMPWGAGNKNYRYPYMPAPDTGPLQVGDGGGLEFLES